jgi:ubiquinone/menaquinone biosynthesis C-methylase UbiE
MPTTAHSVVRNADERDELDRLRRTYEHRGGSALSERYSRTNPGHLYALHEREAAMASLLIKARLKSLAGLRILDVGCGKGTTLRQYLEYDADPSCLWGIDLMPEFTKKANAGLPNPQVTCGSASELPYADSSFDFVSQFMLFTSVLNVEMRHQIAHEINRVLAPGGWLLWYDFAFNNPANPDVRGIPVAEVRRLFPGFLMTSRRITLAPPLGRAIGRLGAPFYFLTSKLRFLCTHYLCLLKKPSLSK